MNTKKRRLTRLLLVVAILLVLLTVSALAHLSASVGPVKNEFSAAEEQAPEIDESFNNTVKSDVRVDVGNPGYAVYVRAAIVVNWEKNGDGNTFHAIAPVPGTDYNLVLNTDDWFEYGGFYYHKAMVEGSTADLIEECKLANNAVVPDGYHLNVKLAAQTIQALGSTDVAVDPYTDGTPAVTNAWGVAVDSDGKLTVPNA